MPDPFDNPEVVAAHRDRGGATGRSGSAGPVPNLQSVTPRAAASRGVVVSGHSIFPPTVPAARAMRGRPLPAGPHLPPPALPGPSGRATHR